MARNSAGQFTYMGLRAHLNLQGGHPMAEVIATESLLVHDDALDIDRQLIAGQPVPPDLIDAYRATVGDTQAATDPGEDVRGTQPPAAASKPGSKSK